MNTQLKTLERQIVERLVRDLLRNGYKVSVNDGEETVLRDSTDRRAILAAMFSTDEDYLHVSSTTRDSKSKSWVRLIYGNDEDVISDYGVNLEYVIKPIYDWIGAKV